MKLMDFQLVQAGVRELLLSEACNDICYEMAVKHLPTSEAWIEGHRHGPSNGNANCKAKSKRLTNKCIGLVVPNNKAAANIAYKYGMR